MNTKKMITLLSFCLLCTTCAFAQNAEDEKAVKASIGKMQELWNKHDINAYNDMYADDATLVNPMGMFSANKAEIVKLHLATNEFYFKFTSTTIEIQKIKFVAPDVALVNTKYNVNIEQDITTPDGSKSMKGDKHFVAILHVLVKKNGTWKIATTQVTNVLTPAK